MDNQKRINRRRFLKGVGAAGLGSVLGSKAFAEDPNVPADPNKCPADPNQVPEKPKYPQVPKRKLGRADLMVPSLSLGTIFNALDNQVILRKAYQWGVTYWDTANNYMNGNSELGIGKFLKASPELREKLFIATKASGAYTAADIETKLQTSLERMNTNYIDLYYGFHGISKPEQYTDELRDWSLKAKERGVIKFFGVTTHENMAESLMAASKLDWIDVVMTSYNFRLMQDEKIQEGIQACYDKGIALIAMKTQSLPVETDGDKTLTEHFKAKGFTEGQAKVKAVLEDQRITTACVGREDISHLTLNIAAVLDDAKMTADDMKIFKDVAFDTCTGYCAGCSNICVPAAPENPHIAEVMRYLMYYNSYGEHKLAKEHFAELPSEVRSRLAKLDYTAAESRCPNHLPIARLMTEAVHKLA